MVLSIPGIVAAADEINGMIQTLIEKNIVAGKSPLVELEINHIFSTIAEQSKRVERLAKKRGGAPADLPAPSYRAYRWLKYLSIKNNLAPHLAAHTRFLEFSREFSGRTNLFHKNHPVRLSLVNSNYLFKGKKKGSRQFIEIHEGFILAEDGVKQALVRAASGSRDSELAGIIRRYARGNAFKTLAAELQRAEKPNRISAVGEVVDLVQVFKKVNRDYFSEKMDQPRLVWSTRRAARRMGSYDPESDTVTINRRLDNLGIPPIAVEYIMFHELLHRKLGIRQSGSRRYAHTAAFKKAEAQFHGKEKADHIIRKLGS